MYKNIISAQIFIYQPIQNFITCSPEVHYTNQMLCHVRKKNPREKHKKMFLKIVDKYEPSPFVVFVGTIAVQVRYVSWKLIAHCT